MEDKKVSVIIPFYNRADWLTEAVESVINQNYNNLEIIVVNDGSKEDVSKFIQKYQDKLIYILKENGGPASARNVGIDKATGEYIAFLDSDDIWCKNKIEKQVELMDRTKAIWSHTNYSLFIDNNQRKLYKKIDVSHYRGNVFPKCLLSSPIATPCVMVSSRYLKENKSVRFAEEMRYGEDGFMWLNLAIKNPLLVVPEELTKVRIRGTNAAFKIRVQLKAKAQLWEHISKNRMLYYGKEKADHIMRTALIMCYYANFIIESLERKKVFNDLLIENISRILYVFPYAISKIYYNLVWKNK